MPVLLQFDFPMNGPWGADMAEALRGLARDIAGTPGLRWKVWTENAAEGRAGGIYLFDDRTSADAYREMHAARLAGFGLRDIRALTFDVNQPLSAITRGPLG